MNHTSIYQNGISAIYLPCKNITDAFKWLYSHAYSFFEKQSKKKKATCSNRFILEKNRQFIAKFRKNIDTILN